LVIETEVQVPSLTHLVTLVIKAEKTLIIDTIFQLHLLTILVTL